MKTIQIEKKKDFTLTILLIVGISFTTLAWVGDIISWSWIGNGFVVDIILLLICIALTIGFVIFYKNYKKRKTITSLTKEQIENLSLDDIKVNLADASYDQNSHELLRIEFQKRLEEIEPHSLESIVITCPSCGYILKYTEERCASCGSSKPACVVCLSDFDKMDMIIKTPCCQQYAHREHILNWINMNGLCPSCKMELDKDVLIKAHFNQ